MLKWFNMLLVVAPTLFVIGCSESDAQNTTVSQADLSALETRVAELEKLVPINFSDTTSLLGEWTLREFEFGQPLLGTFGTIEFVSELDPNTGNTFIIEFRYTGSAVKAFSCSTGDYTLGPDSEDFTKQATITLTCGSTNNQMFVMNSRQNNIRMYHPGQNTMVVLSRDDS